jgi:hypothetical protein
MRPDNRYAHIGQMVYDTLGKRCFRSDKNEINFFVPAETDNAVYIGGLDFRKTFCGFLTSGITGYGKQS